jgi:hypothetical protein
MFYGHCIRLVLSDDYGEHLTLHPVPILVHASCSVGSTKEELVL